MPILVKAKRDGFYDAIYRRTGTQFSVSDDTKFDKDTWFEKVKLFKSGRDETDNVTVILSKSPEGQLQGKTHSTEDIAGVDGDTKLGGAVIDGRAHSPKPVLPQETGITHTDKEVKTAEKHDHKHDKK